MNDHELGLAVGELLDRDDDPTDAIRDLAEQEGVERVALALDIARDLLLARVRLIAELTEKYNLNPQERHHRLP